PCSSKSNSSCNAPSARFCATISSCNTSACAKSIRPNQRTQRKSVAVDRCTGQLMIYKRPFKTQSCRHHATLTFLPASLSTNACTHGGLGQSPLPISPPAHDLCRNILGRWCDNRQPLRK